MSNGYIYLHLSMQYKDNLRSGKKELKNLS